MGKLRRSLVFENLMSFLRQSLPWEEESSYSELDFILGIIGQSSLDHGIIILLLSLSIDLCLNAR